MVWTRMEGKWTLMPASVSRDAPGCQRRQCGGGGTYIATATSSFLPFNGATCPLWVPRSQRPRNPLLLICSILSRWARFPKGCQLS